MKESESPLVQKSEEVIKDGFVMNADEQLQYGRIVEAIVKARNQREQARDEWDGLNYEQAYLSNKRAATTYLQPKKNDDEVRVNTGTTEKRIELVLNELLAMNLEEEVRAFDKDDNLHQEASSVFTDIVRRTEEIEMARDKDIWMFTELLTQPSVFVEELWIEQDKTKGKKMIDKAKRCERRMISGVQMYLGDINLPDVRFNEQPYLVKYARMYKDEADRVFKKLNPDRWKYVKAGSYMTFGMPDPKLYRPNALQADEIEAFAYMSYVDNEVQIIVNGIPMCEVGEKYTKIFGDLGGYHITMVGLKPYSNDFAYSKPLTQSAKTLQALDNETIRNLIRKFRQAIEPPLGVPRGKVYSRDIWNPGAMAQGVKAKDFEKLIDHAGVTRSEMSMFDLIEKKINEFVGTSQAEPLQNKSQVTATELTLAQKQAVKMLGLSVLAATRLKQRLAFLRVENVLANYTKPMGKQVDPITKKVNEMYARFTLADADIEGQQGTRTIQLMDRDLTRDEEMSVFAAEERSKEEGEPKELKTLNVSALKNIRLHFYVTVTTKERESSTMDRALLTDMMNQGVSVMKVTGRPMNANKLITRFERVWNERGLFEAQPPPQPAMAMGPDGQPVQGSNIKAGIDGAAQANMAGTIPAAANSIT